jgi:hypothetical protein
MWYTLEYANTFMCTPAHGGRAGNARDRSPVLVRLYRTSLPDPPRQCRRPVDHHDCVRATLHRSDRSEHDSCLPPAWSCCAAASLVTPALDVDHLRCWGLRVPPGVVAPESADVWQAHQSLDAGAGRRSRFRPGLTPRLVSDETIRLALRRLRVTWKRAKHWITSPDPAYLRKKNDATG